MRTGFIRGLLIISLTCLTVSAQDQAGASRAAFNQGVAAYKSARYAEAARLFQNAADLDPTNANARLYLATTLMRQWVPGGTDPDNQHLAQRAESEFRQVLQLSPDNREALASLASLAYNHAQSAPAAEKERDFDTARDWYQRLANVDPRNKETFYSLGVIAWSRYYPALMAARKNLGMKPEDPGPLADASIRASLQSRFSAVIEDGIAQLNRALVIDSEYDDAMAYLNLLIRERADLVDSKSEYNREVAIADDWVKKALATKKAKAERASLPTPPPLPPPPPGVDGAPQRIRVGGNVAQANLITKISPQYPEDAKRAGIQGVVKYTVLIAKDGTIANIQLISGHPLLVPVSTDAVKQWRYKPTLLNGQPVEVITQIDVTFTLAR